MEQVASMLGGDLALFEYLTAAAVIVLASIMSLFDLPGNTLVILTSLGFAFYDEGKFFDLRIITLMVLVYVLGEIWNFLLKYFGIKKEVKDLSWWAVLLIGAGTCCGIMAGTMVFPVVGSVLGGAAGSFVTSYAYEYFGRSHDKDNACRLALKAAKVQFMAMLARLAATLVLVLLLARQIFFYAG